MALRGDPGITTAIGPVRPPCAVLCRTNAGLFEAAIRGRDRVHVVGGVEPLARLVLGGWRLHLGEQPVEPLTRDRKLLILRQVLTGLALAWILQGRDEALLVAVSQ